MKSVCVIEMMQNVFLYLSVGIKGNHEAGYKFHRCYERKLKSIFCVLFFLLFSLLSFYSGPLSSVCFVMGIFVFECAKYKQQQTTQKRILVVFHFVPLAKCNLITASVHTNALACGSSTFSSRRPVDLKKKL